jgi:hypothetical protein
MKNFQCEAIDFTNLFAEHPLGTLSIQTILKNKSKLLCYADSAENPKGVLVQSGYLHYVFAENTAFIDEIATHFQAPGAYGFAGIPREIATVLCDQFEVEWSNPCTSYRLNLQAYHPERQVHPTRPLRLEDAKLVDRHYPYSGDHTLKMIKEDIKLRPSAAVFIDGNPVAWALQHPDGTIGMMHTLEEHRNKGFARDTTFGMIKAVLKRDEIPVVQISEINEASKTLAKSCGFFPFGTADWFGIISK